MLKLHGERHMSEVLLLESLTRRWGVLHLFSPLHQREVLEAEQGGMETVACFLYHW